MIVIIDYGLGNLGSIKNMLKKIGFDSEITSDLEKISSAEKLILPGVGSFDQGMKNLEERGLIEVLNRKVRDEKTPILGICLGMQLFTKSSEEGVLPGLGWIDAQTIRFDNSKASKKSPIPHMGWEYVRIHKPSKLIEGYIENPKYYFVHSYFVACRNEADVLLKTDYIQTFHAGFEVGNILGVQFHPEKSHKFGMQLLTNFATNY